MRFSQHAFLRVHERLSLTTDEIAKLIEGNRAVQIGKSRRKFGRRAQCVHWLFYSDPDRDWFVAIIDEEANFVLTVIPSYYNHFAIADEVRNQTRIMVVGDSPPRAKPDPVDVMETAAVTIPESASPASQTPRAPPEFAEPLPQPGVLRFVAYVEENGGKILAVKLGCRPTTLRGEIIEEIDSDPEVRKWVEERLREMVDLGKTIRSVCVQINTGPFMQFYLR